MKRTPTPTRRTERGFSGYSLRQTLPSLGLALCLAAFGEPISRHEKPLESARQAYLDTYERFLRNWTGFLREQTRLHTGGDSTLTAGAVVNPWLDLDQECYYFPSFDQIVRPNPLSDNAASIVLKPLPPEGIGQWIPPRFRLAELLGLGQNKVRWEGEFISPTLTDMSTVPVVYALEARIRFHLIGEFQFDEGEPRDVLPTFHRRIDSKSYRQAGVINVRHSNPNRFMVANFSLRKAYATDTPIWTHERLHERLLDESVPVQDTRSEQSSPKGDSNRLADRIRQRLKALQPKYTEAAKNLGAESFLKSIELDKAHQAIVDQLIQAGHQPGVCVLENYSRLPSNATMLQFIQRPATPDSTLPLGTIEETEELIDQIEQHLNQHRLKRP